MRFRRDFRGWRLFISLTHSEQVKGINSKLPSGKHFLMWDFDNIGVEDVKASLVRIQNRYKLPRIFIVNTGLDGYYHSYCFKALPFSKVLEILAETQYLDQAYFKIGVIRGYFTLRYTPKRDRPFMPAFILPSVRKEDINPFELTNFCKYWTKRL